MNPSPIERLALYFEREPTRQGVLARALLGRPGAGDAELVIRLVATLQGELRPDGSLGGAALPTIWRAHELMDLGNAGPRSGVARTLDWILGLQGRAGAFGEGCDRARHAQRVCEHFVDGFFSPGPPEQRLTPITLPNGKVFRAEPAARFAISCLALRACLRARLHGRALVRRHVDSLARLAERWTDWNGYFAPDVILAGIHALAAAGPEYRTEVDRVVNLALAQQSPDGDWPNADLFSALETLCAIGTETALKVVRRAVPQLEQRQRLDGSFGATAQQERALIGLRALVWAERGL